MAADEDKGAERMAEANARLWRDFASLWQVGFERLAGRPAPPVISPEPGDRRFKDEAWTENPAFDVLKQSYLLASRWLRDMAGAVPGMDEQAAGKLDFLTRQFIDAMAPTNFPFTNPEVLRATVESKGENLKRGLANLEADLKAGMIRMADPGAFEVGVTLAATPGTVVFRNDLIELIQYAPMTPSVRKRPLLVIPPWINKYYILDLRPKNSFVRWAVESGLTVFVISWVNPGRELAAKTFADYMTEGPLAALDAIRQAIGETRVDALGYCLGGTLLSATLAVMAARGDSRIPSATLLTTLTDFSRPGELGVFIDEAQVGQLEARMQADGVLDGRDMAAVFASLRANDLIWSFAINNYLLGKDPEPFDLLYWNSDPTRMPAAMHGFTLRSLYLENRLVLPGGVTLDGTTVDLAAIRVPLYMLSTREDHIAPWKSTYALTQRVSGPVRFVLAASGHIAGVVNPPGTGKYGHWINPRRPADPETWLAKAKPVGGSWWPDWRAWLGARGGKTLVPARIPGDGGLKALMDAPGSYVKVR